MSSRLLTVSGDLLVISTQAGTARSAKGGGLRTAAFSLHLRTGDQSFGAGIGDERSGFGSGTARNSFGGDFQSKGAAGRGCTHGVSKDWPCALRTSNTRPGFAISAQFCQSAMASHSPIAVSPFTMVPGILRSKTRRGANWRPALSRHPTPARGFDRPLRRARLRRGGDALTCRRTNRRARRRSRCPNS